MYYTVMCAASSQKLFEPSTRGLLEQRAQVLAAAHSSLTRQIFTSILIRLTGLLQRLPTSMSQCRYNRWYSMSQCRYNRWYRASWRWKAIAIAETPVATGTTTCSGFCCTVACSPIARSCTEAGRTAFLLSISRPPHTSYRADEQARMGREGTARTASETARMAAPLPVACFSPEMKCIRTPKASTNICCHRGDLKRASPDAYTYSQQARAEIAQSVAVGHATRMRLPHVRTRRPNASRISARTRQAGHNLERVVWQD
jgi:hypothetical protein